MSHLESLLMIPGQLVSLLRRCDWQEGIYHSSGRFACLQAWHRIEVIYSLFLLLLCCFWGVYHKLIFCIKQNLYFSKINNQLSTGNNKKLVCYKRTNHCLILHLLLQFSHSLLIRSSCIY